MGFHKLAVFAFTVSCATLAAAQNPASRPAANTGFFRPAADPNLTAPRPAERATRPTEALVAEDRAQASTERSNDRTPEPAAVLQWSERQMDRSEHEAEKAKPLPGTPAPINGAFTGSTNPRDR